MDFNFTEEQTAIRELAREILEKEVSQERLKEIEKQGDFFDRASWAALAESNLLGLAIAEEHGGMGMGFLELCLLLGELGRAVAPTPAFATLALCALPIARFGSDVQQKEWLGAVVRGEAILTGAFEAADRLDARRVGNEFVLDGVCHNVPALELAKRVLIPVSVDGTELVLLVDPESDGVTFEARKTSRHEPIFELRFAGTQVPGDSVLEGEGIHAWILERALVGLAALQVGVSEKALEITTGYLKQREQFGAPLGALPVVQHRCADAYIALDSMRWVTWQAAWKLAHERPASRAAWVAKFWACDAGSKIGTATQHLHGGMGVDLDYPIHRYFLWAKSIELALGAATPTLLALGSDMARTGPQEFA